MSARRWHFVKSNVKEASDWVVYRNKTVQLRWRFETHNNLRIKVFLRRHFESCHENFPLKSVPIKCARKTVFRTLDVDAKRAADYFIARYQAGECDQAA